MVEQHRSVILEIGPNRSPVYKLKRESPSLNTYFNMDDNIEALNQVRIRWATGREVLADMYRAIPLKEESVDEIWLMNVIGENGIDGYNYFEPLMLRSGREVFSRPACILFQEMTRVIKNTGTIYIGEYYTPPQPSWLTDRDYSQFGLQKKVYMGERACRTFQREHKLGNEISFGFKDPKQGGNKSFFLVLKKNQSLSSAYE